MNMMVITAKTKAIIILVGTSLGMSCWWGHRTPYDECVV